MERTLVSHENELLLSSIKLPLGFSFYEVDGNKIFPIREENGEFKGSEIFYITNKINEKYVKNAIEIKKDKDLKVQVLDGIIELSTFIFNELNP